MTLSLTNLFDSEESEIEKQVPTQAVVTDTASEKQKAEMDHRWELIREFVLGEPACYQKKACTSFVSKTAKLEQCTVYA